MTADAVALSVGIWIFPLNMAFVAKQLSLFAGSRHTSTRQKPEGVLWPFGFSSTPPPEQRDLRQ